MIMYCTIQHTPESFTFLIDVMEVHYKEITVCTDVPHCN